MTITAFNLLKKMGLSHHGAVELLPKVKAQSFDADTVIQDGHLKSWIFIIDGLVGARSAGCGDMLPVSVYGCGAWFGQTNLFDDNALTFEYLCLTTTRTFAIPLQDIRNAFEREDGFSRYLVRLFSDRAQRHAETLHLMRDGGPCLRIVMGLAVVAEAIRAPGSRTLKTTHCVKGDDSLIIPVKQALLASMCGVSRGVFSTCLQQLAAANWVSMSYSSLVVLRITTWMRFYSSCRRMPLEATKLDMVAILGLMQESALADAADCNQCEEKNSKDCTRQDKQAH